MYEASPCKYALQPETAEEQEELNTDRCSKGNR